MIYDMHIFWKPSKRSSFQNKRVCSQSDPPFLRLSSVLTVRQSPARVWFSRPTPAPQLLTHAVAYLAQKAWDVGYFLHPGWHQKPPRRWISWGKVIYNAVFSARELHLSHFECGALSSRLMRCRLGYDYARSRGGEVSEIFKHYIKLLLFKYIYYATPATRTASSLFYPEPNPEKNVWKNTIRESLFLQVTRWVPDPMQDSDPRIIRLCASKTQTHSH